MGSGITPFVRIPNPVPVLSGFQQSALCPLLVSVSYSDSEHLTQEDRPHWFENPNAGAVTGSVQGRSTFRGRVEGWR